MLSQCDGYLLVLIAGAISGRPVFLSGPHCSLSLTHLFLHMSHHHHVSLRLIIHNYLILSLSLKTCKL